MVKEITQQVIPPTIDYLLFYVNGKQVIEHNAEPDWTLLWYLRNKLNLTGSKLGCGEGGCGACTVLISQCINRHTGHLEHRTVNACLAPLCSVDGCHIITVEGLGSVAKSNLHPAQSRLAEMYGSQCGFCTPGIVMSLYGTVTSSNHPHSSLTMLDIEEAFDGNLCRCTGYRPILDAAKTFAKDLSQLPCKDSLKSSKPTTTTLDKCLSFVKKIDKEPHQIEFPDELRQHIAQSIFIKGSLIEWYRPVTLNELLQLRSTYPGSASKLIFGNTEVQIETKFKRLKYPRFISITHIEELQQLKRTPTSLVLGAGVTLTRLHEKLTEWNDQKLDGGICQALTDQLKYFASTQIRNVASLGGNIVNASPISDVNPVLQAANALLELHRAEANSIRLVPLRDFFLSYRRVAMTDDEVLVNIHIPLPSASLSSPSNRTFLRSYKQARRRDDDIGIVSSGLQVELEPIESTDKQQWRIVCAHFSFGGMGPTTILAKNTQQELIGQLWTKSTIDKACELAVKEMPLNDMTPGGQPEYRRTLVQSFLFKFYVYVCSELNKESVDSKELSIAHPYHRPVSHGQQIIPERPTSQKVVGTSLPHRSAYLQTTGEAKYIDDMPSLAHTLHAALVLATQPNARIKNIDLGAASKVPGFVSFVNHQDVPGDNMTGDVVHDEEVFVSSITPCVGAVIGIVLCETERAAHAAAHLVQIEYELLTPTIYTIDDAIQHQSYIGEERCLNQGDIEKALAEAENILEDTIVIGGQEHFYLETNCCMVIPSNDDKEITLYSSTQNPSKTQELTALALGCDVSHVQCHVKRMGGGFGGKESRSIAPCVALAVAAVKVGRPVRMNIERDVDMSITGQRHPFKIHYKVGFTNQGEFTALDIRLWSNAGCSFDLSMAVLERAMLHVDNTYRFQNVRVRGRLCKTHLPSNTAFRGFGGPQGLFGCETIVDHIATHLKLDPLVIRRLNMYREGDITHFKQPLERWNIPRLMDELLISSDFNQRQKSIEEYNKLHTYRKRGITILPTKFGIAFTAKFLNQAGALVHIYKDGSVLVSHGGTEMGQGLHTKMISVAAEALSCDVDRVRISETATDKVPNTSPTAASASSDLNGMAIRIACEEIRERLNKVAANYNTNLSWEDLIKKAYFSRISLSAQGFYATPEPLGADFANNEVHFNYFTQGAAVSEVELDTLTGDWHILRADILMDVGTSLNPQIDIGQIEGAFVQGYGLFTMEELIWGDQTQHKWTKPGALFTRGPGTYKIPSFNDVPLDMRVELLSDAPNPLAIYSSKAIGEPPLFLGASVFFALKNACMAYREQQGYTGYFPLNSPATVERLRMACTDEFTERACVQNHEQFQAKVKIKPFIPKSNKMVRQLTVHLCQISNNIFSHSTIWYDDETFCNGAPSMLVYQWTSNSSLSLFHMDNNIGFQLDKSKSIVLSVTYAEERQLSKDGTGVIVYISTITDNDEVVVNMAIAYIQALIKQAHIKYLMVFVENTKKRLVDPVTPIITGSTEMGTFTPLQKNDDEHIKANEINMCCLF
ncbi:unnamed protein product [Adineta steineri]|uniref:xanthine dehydrogenase n=1 Tax=Adineta steineri TaxID=433720 RepID=A0A814CIH9_9BILA|nr:unnamed protein product [Adineta steineri]CAF0940550.1 unnamed protein product [Adineta steineri]